MSKAGYCGSGGNCGGPKTGDGKDLSLIFLRVGAAVSLAVAGLFFSRRERPPRQLLLPPPPASGTPTMSRLKPVAASFQKQRDAHRLQIMFCAVDD
jgi:hypothetical protein